MLAKVIGWFRRSGKQLAGMDKAGNSYFREPETVEGALTERRWVKFKSSPDPSTVPVEWNSWLNGRRKEAPTPEEIMELEARRKLTKLKAALLEKEEEKRRYRAKTLQQGMTQDDVSPRNMSLFLQQVTGGDLPAQGQESSDSYTRTNSPRYPSTWIQSFLKGLLELELNALAVILDKNDTMVDQAASGPQAGMREGMETVFRPGVWTPNVQDKNTTRSAEPEGRGDTFKPGTWQAPK